jgi:hypothetical protein
MLPTPVRASARPLTVVAAVKKTRSSPSSTNQIGTTCGRPSRRVVAGLPVRVPAHRNLGRPRRLNSAWSLRHERHSGAVGVGCVDIGCHSGEIDELVARGGSLRRVCARVVDDLVHPRPVRTHGSNAAGVRKGNQSGTRASGSTPRSGPYAAGCGGSVQVDGTAALDGATRGRTQSSEHAGLEIRLM